MWEAFAALSLAGTAANAFGQIQKGNEARRAGEEAARLNEMDAKYAAVLGEDQVSTLEGRMVEYMGGQRQAAGVSNVKIEGSPMEQLLRTVSITENDIARTRRNVAIEVNKLNYAAQVARRTGQVAQQQSRFAAAGAILGGIGQVGTSYYQGRSVSSGVNPVTGTVLPTGAGYTSGLQGP